jgi:thioredoxin reductase
MSIESGPLIVGGGPSGLAAAIELRRLGVDPVTVVEREREAGGIPRHSNHTGFGARDLHRVMSGPRYAERYRELAAEAGVEVLSETMVTDWDEDGALWLTGPGGRRKVKAPAVVLATGCRERPRSARLVPGMRGPGVMTTSTLQQLVYLKGRHGIGERAVVVGAEHVSFSAIATLAHGGASTAALVTEHPRHQSLAAFRAGARLRFGAPVLTRSRLTAINGGGGRVEEVEVTGLDSGLVRTIACDLVVFSADWIPDHELTVMAGCELDPGTLGPRVDGALRTAVPGVFAAGNLVHPAETADSCALGGRHAARAVVEHLEAGSSSWPSDSVPVLARGPLRWVVPNLIPPGGGAAPRGRFLLRSRSFLRAPRLEVVQGEKTLWRGRLARLVPGRSAQIPARWTESVDPTGGPIAVRVRE